MESKKKNVWVSLYRAVDSDRNTLGFLLRLMRDAKAIEDLKAAGNASGQVRNAEALPPA